MRRAAKRYWVASSGIWVALALGCDEDSRRPVVWRAAKEVEGFHLVIDDAAAKGDPGLFGVNAAILANYEYFTYEGSMYTTVGRGSVVIRPVSVSPAAFVREGDSADGRQR